MLKTVEAEIQPDGTVTLLEPVEVKEKTRAILTLLENGGGGQDGLPAIRRLLEKKEFKERRAYPAAQIEAEIEESRNAWE